MGVEPLQAMMVDAAGAVDIPAELADEDIDRMVAELLENDTVRCTAMKCSLHSG